MSEIVFLIEDAPDGGMTARALGASIFTEAETLDELRVAVRDAVACHYEETPAQDHSIVSERLNTGRHAGGTCLREAEAASLRRRQGEARLGHPCLVRRLKQ